MHAHDLGLTALAFFSETLGTVSGFGSSTFFVPAATAFENIRFVLALVALLHCFGNLSKITLFGEYFRWAPFVRLALPSILLTGVGALLSDRASPGVLTRYLGFFLMAIPLVFLFGGKWLRSMPREAAVLLSGFSGFSSGLIGTGGALRGLALAALGLEKNTFVCVSAAIDLAGDLLRAGIYLGNGYMDWSQWFYLPLLGAAALLGSWVGKRLLARIQQSQFEKIVAGFVFLSGLLMVV